MFNRHITLVLLCLAVVCSAAEPRIAQAPVRLAVIEQDNPDPALAEMLTARLSSFPGIALLERSEIQKIYREQALTGASHDYSSLGRMLGAEGLLIVTRARQGEQERMDLRMVATGPGVVLGVVSSEWPQPKAADWSEWASRHFESLLPKLAVPLKDAIPLSVVNVRSAMQSPQARETENQVLRLLIESLSRQPKLFVLERRRLETLQEEKELSGATGTAFWNGSYLLETVVDRDGYAQQTITFSGRLNPPKGGAPILIEAGGARTNLAEAVKALADKVVEALNLRGQAPAWNPSAEADRFFQEAKWACKWEGFSEAAAACEAAWALGKQTRDLAELRIQAYADAGLDTARGSFDLEGKQVVFKPGVRPVPGQFPVLRSDYPGSIAPDPRKFASLLRALDLYRQGIEPFAGTQAQPDWDWYDLGLDLLENASFWLRHYYYVPAARSGQEEAIAAAQALARDIAADLTRHPGFKNCFDRPSMMTTRVNWGFPPLGASERKRESIYSVKANWGCYWSDTPEGGCELYRGLIEAGVMPRLRPLFLDMDFLERSPVNALSPSSKALGGTLQGSQRLSYLADWKSQDRGHSLAVLHEFIEQLSRSTNDSVRLEGMFLNCSLATTDTAHDRAFRDLIAFIEQPRPAAKEMSAASFDGLLQPKWRNGFDTNAWAARKELWARHTGQLALAAPAQTPNPRMSPMAMAGAAKFAPPMGSGRKPAGMPGMFPGPGAAFGPGQTSYSKPGGQAGALAVSNILEVTRFFPLPGYLPGSTNPVRLSVVGCCFREGRIWLDTRFDQLATRSGMETFFNHGAILSVDPQSFKFETILLAPGAFALSPEFMQREVLPSFEVHKGWLYVSSYDVLKRYSLQAKTWENLPVPIKGHARLCVVGDRLLLSTKDSIMEIAESGREARLLASNRRQPPVTTLDSIDDYDCAPLMEGPGGSLVTLVSGKLYQRAQNADNWSSIETPWSLTPKRSSLFDGGMLVLTEAPYEPGRFMGRGGLRGRQRLFAVYKNSTAVECLAAEPPGNNSVLRIPSSDPDLHRSPDPRWAVPSNLPALNYPFCLDGRTLWVFYGTLALGHPGSGRLVLGDPDEGQPILLRLKPGQAKPLAFELRLKLPAQLSGGLAGIAAAPSPFSSVKTAKTLLLVPTPEGLILANRSIPGFWLLPRAQLETQP